MKLITKDEVAKLFNVRNRTIETWVRNGKFPRPLKIGRHIWWDEEVLMAWVKNELIRGLQSNVHQRSLKKGEER